MQNILNTETKINLRIQNIIISLRRDKRACDRSFRCDSVLTKLLLDQLIKNYFSDYKTKIGRGKYAKTITFIIFTEMRK